jgi:hypothetical protein
MTGTLRLISAASLLRDSSDRGFSRRGLFNTAQQMRDPVKIATTTAVIIVFDDIIFS